MSGITLKNPVVNSVPTAISAGRKAVDVQGMSLSTGLKANNDVVSSFLGQNLGDRAKVSSKILTAMGYSSNVIQTARDGLESMAKTLTEMLGIINSVGGSKTATRTLNDMFQLKLKALAQQTNSAEFDGRKLLTGELGSDGIAKAKYDTKPVNVRKIGSGADVSFQGIGAQANKTINFVDLAKIKDGDTITLEGVVFTMKDEDSWNKDDENQIAIGTTLIKTVGSVVTAIKNHSSEALRPYDVFARNEQVIIQQRSQSSANISLIINSPLVGMVDNSQPSAYSWEFMAGATIGSGITISGVQFTYVAAAVPGDPTKVPNGGHFTPSAQNLADAIANHPVTKDLIDKKMLSVTWNPWGCVTILSTLDQSILGFSSQLAPGNNGNIRNNLVTKSGETTYASRVTFNAVSGGGDTVTINIPGVGNRVFNVPGATPAAGCGPAIHQAMLADGPTNAYILAGKLSISSDQISGALTVYSNDNLNLTYAGAAAAFGPIPISPNDVSVIKAAIDVSKIRNLEGFIGTPSAKFRVIAQAVSAGGDGAAENLYKISTLAPATPTVAANGDSVAIVEVDIAGRTFQSVVWKGNGGNLSNRTIVFKEGSGGESFTINTKDFDADFTSLSTANETLTQPLITLFSSTVFAQTRDIEIDTSSEKIINTEGKVIGNLTGMTASLDSTDFNNKEIQDFVMIPNQAVLGQVIFIATISGQEFTTTLDVAELNEGAAITLKCKENGDTLTINVGKDGLNSLKEPENYGFVASAIKKSLMKIGSGLDVRVGFDPDNTSKVVVADVSATKLYRDNQNNYVPKLDLLTKENVRIAQEVITNAVDYVRSAQAELQGQGEGIAKSATSLSSATGVTKDASAGYLDTELVEAASAFAAALKSILAAINTLQAGAKVADAGLDIIRSAAAA